MDNRRSAERLLTMYPAEIGGETGTEPLLAFISDLSLTGALLLVRSELKVGEELPLALYILEDPNTPLRASGKVVRTTRVERGRSGLWRYTVAVAFDPPLEAHRAAIEALREKLPKPGGG